MTFRLVLGDLGQHGTLEAVEDTIIGGVNSTWILGWGGR